MALTTVKRTWNFQAESQAESDSILEDLFELDNFRTLQSILNRHLMGYSTPEELSQAFLYAAEITLQNLTDREATDQIEILDEEETL